jgi:hypothetical protein
MGRKEEKRKGTYGMQGVFILRPPLVHKQPVDEVHKEQ